MNLVVEYFFPEVWYAQDFSDFAQSIAEQLDGFGTLEDATWHTHLPKSSMICVGPRFTNWNQSVGILIMKFCLEIWPLSVH